MTSRVLDCDLVFDALTRGPFPSGEREDEIIDAHLQSCHECRRIAEALRPAVDLFHESLPDDDKLPGYQGQLQSADQGQVQAIMTAVRNEGPQQRVQPILIRRIDPLSVVAAAIVGLVLGLLIASSDKPLNEAGAVRQPALAHRPGPDGLALLTKLDLIQDCRAQVQEKPPRTAPPHNGHAFYCCTRCHRYSHGEHSPELPHMSKLLRGCQACHDA